MKQEELVESFRKSICNQYMSNALNRIDQYL